MNEVTIKSNAGVTIKVYPDMLTWTGDHACCKHYVVEEECDQIVLRGDGDDPEYATATAEVDGHELQVAEDGAEERTIYIDGCEAEVDDDDPCALWTDELEQVLRVEGELRDAPDEDAQREAIEEWVATLPAATVWRIDRCRGFANEWTLWYGLSADPTGQCGDDAEIIADRDEVIDYLMDALADGGADNYRTVRHADDTCNYTYSVVVDGVDGDWDKTRDEAVASARDAIASGAESAIIRRWEITMDADGEMSEPHSATDIALDDAEEDDDAE